MLYLDGTDTKTCAACGRKWIVVDGIREPVEDDEFREDEDGCLSCDGDW